ncbi:hypothetical protein [Oryza sativa Japonica Group]|uniref:Secreted protein n=1 Tax=Oryza sativa subsp. japonica TaxID=39947 RepID=Q5ZEI7_ORYSJ|nr:hypothetical protein [Oryza sativa Japonica Group]
MPDRMVTIAWYLEVLAWSWALSLDPDVFPCCFSLCGDDTYDHGDDSCSGSASEMIADGVGLAACLQPVRWMGSPSSLSFSPVSCGGPT